MALANLIDQVTIGSISIATIDADPVVNGYTASLGSFAQYTNGSNVVFFYQKTSAADTAWTQVDLGLINLTSQVSGVLPPLNGGTGFNGTTAANGALPIGNGTGFTLATLTAGSGLSITNTAGSITIASVVDGVTGVATINTTNNTVTTIASIATTTDKTTLLTVSIIGTRTGGTAGTAGNCYTAKRTLTLKNIAGTVTIKTTSSDYTNNDDILNIGGVTFTVSGTTVLVKVQGATNNNFTWKVTALSVTQ